MLRSTRGQSRTSGWHRSVARIVSTAALVLAMGVSHAVTTDAEFDEAVDFSRFKTFKVLDGRLTSRAPALNSELTRKRIQSEIEKRLIKKGLKIAESGSPDLTVSFQFGSARTLETKTYPAGWRGLRTRAVTAPQAEGTMVIDLRDATTNALVWRSTAMEGEPNPVKLADKLDDMVKKSIAKYPPRKSKR
jgi:hypothetical protein